MANKTIDRKKAVPTRAQAAKASPKNASTKPARPSGSSQGKPSDLKAEKATRAGAEVLEVEDVETDELAVDEEDEADEEAVDEVEEDEADEEEEEEVVEEKPARSRAAKPRKERELVVSPQDYSVSKPAKSPLLNNPLGRFVRASYRELRLVTWPSRRDTWNWSLVVVGVCVAIAVLLGAIDFGLAKFVTWWLSLAQ